MRKRTLGLVALASAVMLVGAACGGGGDTGGGTGDTGDATTFQKGGTARVALLSDVTAALDPAKEYYSVGWNILRVMNRTLLAYPSAVAPTGNNLVPDVAVDQGQASADNTTWTFKLKPNVEFGPPISRPIVCEDFKAAFERMFTPAGEGGYNFYYTVIKGAENFKPGGDMEGITCPDPQTITFQLTEPTGDFNFRVAMPATAPVPAAENATKGHEQDWGRFMPASGCYQWEGIENVSYTGKSKPASGYQPNRSMTLVRNPNWDPATDDVRKCYIDRYEVKIGGESSDIYNKIQAGRVDWLEDQPSDAQSLQTFKNDPNLQDQVGDLNYSDSTYWIYMNTTLAPFDDVHVRKAVNWIVNKDALLRIRGGPDFGQVATHIVPPSMSGALPATYDPYATPGHRGDLNKAMAEMKQSKYDTDQDGKCDAAQCNNVFHVTDSADPYPDLTASFSADLAKIGIELKTRGLDRGTMYNFYGAPARKVAIGSGGGWGKDYPDALTFIEPIFYGPNIQPTGNVNYSQVDDPTLNTMIDKCKGLSGTERAGCWAQADRYIMENIAPFVPWRWGAHRYIWSDRIATGSFKENQFASEPAWDQIALTQQAITQG